MGPGPKTQPLKFTMHTNHDSTAVNLVISADIEHLRIIPYAGISIFTIGIIQNAKINRPHTSIAFSFALCRYRFIKRFSQINNCFLRSINNQLALFKFLLFVYRRLHDTFLTIISNRYLITNIIKLHVSFFTVHFRHISNCAFYILLHSRYQRRPVLIILNSGLQNSHLLFVSRHIPLITADKTCCKYCKTSQ